MRRMIALLAALLLWLPLEELQAVAARCSNEWGQGCCKRQGQQSLPAQRWLKIGLSS